MKKLTLLALILTLCACAETTVVEERPAVQPAPAPTQYCGRCNTSSYTVRKPVKVIYENTTYTTVYEPRTYSTTTYETRPYNSCENKNLCY